MRRLLFFLFIAPALVLAQRDSRGPRIDEPPQFLFFEAVNLPSVHAPFSRVDLLYRIDRDFFVAVRNTDRAAALPFRRHGEILFELVDSTGTSRAREMRSIDIPEQAEEERPEGRAWVEGILSVDAPPGRYTITLEITDSESKRNHLDRARSIVVRPMRGSVSLSDPLFVLPADSSATSAAPINYGGEMLFGSRGALMFDIAGIDSSATIEADYRIVAGGAGEDTALVISVAARPYPIRRAALPSIDAAAARPLYRFDRAADDSTAILIIPFDSQNLPLRRYAISGTIGRGARERHFSHSFRTVWPEMPLSLRDIDYAIEALRYITSEQQFDSLRGGDLRQRRDNLEAFWKSKDRSRASAKNEVMAEYYRRVDHAMRSFGTLKQPDGSKSDRGRIYILQGPPDSTERTLDSSRGHVEVWRYDRAKVTYTFLDASRTGDYRLAGTARE